MTTHSDTDQLAALVDDKLHVLELLKRLAEQQLALIDTGDMPLLMKLLAAKQTLLPKLQRLDRQLDPFRAQDPDERVWPSAEARRRCQQKAERCAALLAELMSLEKTGEQELLRRRDGVAARLQGVHGAAEASSAYATSGTNPGLHSNLCDQG